jgi:hypothetical protein
MHAGYGKADITPADKITLCGFVARGDNPLSGIDDPLSVHSLIIEQAGQKVMILAFDLLGLGEEITEQLHRALDSLNGLAISRQHRVFCCTHTHSAPATIKLIGCGVIEPAYVEGVIISAKQAVLEAAASLQEAKLRTAELTIHGANYNRRRILEDGRVVMNQHPKQSVRRTGPTWDDFFFLRFEDTGGNPIAGIVNWAAHPCTVCSAKVSGDHPGELCRRLSQRFDLPFFYLQGACGDLNPPLQDMTRQDMLDNVDSIMRSIPNISWGQPVETAPFATASGELSLQYQPSWTISQITEFHDAMRSIAETGHGPKAQMNELANVLNVAPGEEPDPEMVLCIASALRQWSRELITSAEAGRTSDRCDISINLWRMGSILFCFVPAEVFAETAIRIRDAFPHITLVFVGYSSPLIGYLPTNNALHEGGYEVDYAYRFYGHSAAFAEGSEPAVAQKTMELIQSLL